VSKHTRTAGRQRQCCSWRERAAKSPNTDGEAAGTSCAHEFGPELAPTDRTRAASNAPDPVNQDALPPQKGIRPIETRP